jgi:hypothetical protein
LPPLRICSSSQIFGLRETQLPIIFLEQKHVLVSRGIKEGIFIGIRIKKKNVPAKHYMIKQVIIVCNIKNNIK